MSSENRKIRRKQDLLIKSLIQFYNTDNHAETMVNITEGKNRVSLRLIEWFVTNFSKKNNVIY